MSAPTAPAIHVADVRAGHGPRWIAEAFHLYRARPVSWTGLALGWLVITLGLTLLPLIGGVIATLLQPVFFASFAIAARRQLAGERVEMGDLFLGFRANARALVMVGAVELAAATVVVLAVAIVAGPSEGVSATAPAEEIAKALRDKAPYLLAGLLVMGLVKGALWFAPPLIAFHGLSAMHAIRWSVYAALSNFGAMVAYLLALLAAYVLAALPWLLGLIVLLPVMCLSTFTGYRDVFERPMQP